MKHLSDELLKQIVLRLVDSLHPLEIYLFGSHASGKTHEHSDIDLMVVVPNDAGDRHELERRGYLALAGMKVPIELVVFPRREIDKWAPVRFSLPHEGIRKGKRLYAA